MLAGSQQKQNLRNTPARCAVSRKRDKTKGVAIPVGLALVLLGVNNPRSITMTKLELEQINTRLAAENAALRAENTSLKVLAEAKSTRTEYVADEEKVHEYPDFAAAQQRCKELVAWDTQRKFKFVQRGTRVICKVR